MNIDAYYARQMDASTYPMDYTSAMAASQSPEQMYPNMSENDRMRPMTMINSRPNTPDMSTQQQRMQQQASSYMYQNMPPPALGPINRQTYGDISQIYYRHYLNGTYGTPEMFKELQSYVDTLRQQQEATPRPTPIGTPVTSQYMGMGWQGTPVVETSYQPQQVAAPINTAQNRATLEARLREMMAKMGQKTGPSTPMIGGPGGLPGPR